MKTLENRIRDLEVTVSGLLLMIAKAEGGGGKISTLTANTIEKQYPGMIKYLKKIPGYDELINQEEMK